MAAVPSTLEPMKLGSGYNTPWWANALKWGLIALVVGFAAYVAQRLISSGAWFGVVITAFVLMCVLAVYSTRRFIPMKYLLRTTYQLGQLLQSARKRAGWSQTELAVRINLSQSRLSKLEQNPGSMTVDQLLALCGSLGLD